MRENERSRIPYRKRSVLLLSLLLCLTTSLHTEEQLRGDWVRFSLSGRASAPADWGASSVLESDDPLLRSRYGPEKAMDGEIATAWVEGAPGPGIGETYLMGTSAWPEALGFHNGFAGNEDLFQKNFRVQELSVRVYAAVIVGAFSTERVTFYDALPISETRSIHLSDTRDAQRVPLPFDRQEIRDRMEEFRNSAEIVSWKFPIAEKFGVDGSEGLSQEFRYLIRLEINAVYPGTRWEDTCIAELWPDYGDASEVTVSDNGRSLVITKAGGEQIRTYNPFDYLVTLLETSRDNTWALVLHEPYYHDGGRVSTEYSVIHLPTGRDMGGSIFGESSLDGSNILPTGFVEYGSTTYLEYEDFITGETGQIPCTLYRN